MATDQDELLKQILDFPYETLGIKNHKDKFDKSGYLSELTTKKLLYNLKKYDIIGFEFGTFSEYSVQYNISIKSPPCVFKSQVIEGINGHHVYAIYVSNTGVCYGNYQISNVIPYACLDGREVYWNEELFNYPFMEWQHTGRPYQGQNDVLYRYHWTRLRSCKCIEKDVNIQDDIDVEGVYSVIRSGGKLFEFSLQNKNIQSGGFPIKYLYGTEFKNITIHQIKECERRENIEKKELELKEVKHQEKQKIIEKIKLQKTKFLSENQEYLHIPLYQSELKKDYSSVPFLIKYKSYLEYLYDTYGNIYKNLNSMIKFVMNQGAIDILKIRFDKYESEKFLLLYRKQKELKTFNKLKNIYYTKKYLDLEDITEPSILFSICCSSNNDIIEKYTKKLIENRNTLNCDLDNILLLMEILKEFYGEFSNLITVRQRKELLKIDWPVKGDLDWSKSIYEKIFELTLSKGIINKFSNDNSSMTINIPNLFSNFSNNSDEEGENYYPDRFVGSDSEVPIRSYCFYY
jgi:hypothetical protein